jgi:dihydroflavonol-4-reductase
VRRVVVASTSGTIAVGSDPDVVHDESAQAPLELVAMWPYYRSKLYAEREALALNQPPDFEVVVVNPSLLLGPGDLRESSTGDVRLFLNRRYRRCRRVASRSSTCAMRRSACCSRSSAAAPGSATY